MTGVHIVQRRLDTAVNLLCPRAQLRVCAIHIPRPRRIVGLHGLCREQATGFHEFPVLVYGQFLDGVVDTEHCYIGGGASDAMDGSV